MKILIVSKAFHPQVNPRSFRTTELATELVRQGHDVTVAVPVDREGYLEYCEQHSIKLIDLGRPRWHEVEIKGGGITRLLRRGIRRGANLLFYYPEIEIYYQIKRVLRNQSGYDLAITVAAPHAVHWGFRALLAKMPQICRSWIADCGDPFMGVTIDTFRKPFYFKYWEKRFCRMADFITVPVEGAVEAYYPEFHSKIRIIPQGFKFPEPNFLPAYEPNPVPTFAFAGGFIPGVRDPRPILEFLSSRSRPFKFICYTKQAEMLESFSERLGNRMEVRGFIARDQLLRELGKMDFLLNIENRTKRQSPSKLIDYAITGRPILSLDSFALNQAALEQFLGGDYSQQFKLPDLANYRIENVARSFIELTRKVHTL